MLANITVSNVLLLLAKGKCGNCRSVALIIIGFTAVLLLIFDKLVVYAILRAKILGQLIEAAIRQLVHGQFKSHGLDCQLAIRQRH